MTIAKIVMMQKDEEDLLVRWLSHYIHLFGARNITIMDNGSRKNITVNILKFAESLGVNVMWGYDTSHDFLHKGGHFKNIINSWDNDFAYEFAIPVDCDEIIAVFKDDCISLDKDDILSEMTSLIGTTRALRMDMSLFNVPSKPGWFSPDRFFHKGFLAARTIGEMDNGHHSPTSRVMPGYFDTKLTYLHYHNREFSEFQRLSRAKLSHRIDGDITNRKLEEYRKVDGRPGSHLVKNLLISETDYNVLYDKEVQVCIRNPWDGGSAELTKIYTMGSVIEWDSISYILNNPDVKAYSSGPLHHYLRYGWTEGRKV